MAARLEAPRAAARPVTGTAPARRAGLAWPRLPAAAELATIGAGYAAYALVRLAIHADRPAAFAHAAQLWQAERRLHLRIEPWLNRLAAARPPLAEAAGYYYGLLHFLVTPLVLAWLYWRRPAASGRLRSALVLATTAANVVFRAWPAAPPRLAVPGMTDILATRDILGAAGPHGATSLVNLYAAMPSLHVAWAAWSATAIVITTRSRRRHLAWLYPAATTLVVLASASHFVLDAAGGLAVTALGMLAASRPGRLAASRRARPASPGHRHAPRTRAPARASSRDGLPARPAARRARRRGRRRARRAHPHRHPARSGSSRSHPLPAGRVLGRRRRRDRGGGHPHPPPQPRTGDEAPTSQRAAMTRARTAFRPWCSRSFKLPAGQRLAADRETLPRRRRTWCRRQTPWTAPARSGG